MSRLTQSLAAGLNAPNTRGYIWNVYRVAILVMLLTITMIQIEVHLTSLEGTGVAESARNMGELLHLFIYALIAMWAIEVAVATWQTYTEDDHHRQEVSSVE